MSILIPLEIAKAAVTLIGQSKHGNFIHDEISIIKDKLKSYIDEAIKNDLSKDETQNVNKDNGSLS